MDQKFILIPILMLLLFSTCKKDEEEMPCVSCPEEGSIADMKEWFYFQPGSYWIYEEENSGALDTVHVFAASEGVASNGQAWFRVETQSSVLEEWLPDSWVKYNYIYRFSEFNSQNCRFQPSCTCHILERVKSRPLNFVAATNMLLFPFMEGEFVYVGGGGTSQHEGFLDTLSTPAHEFYDVASIYHETDITERDLDVIYRFSTNEGMVQKRYPSEGMVWNLIEYNVIQ